MPGPGHSHHSSRHFLRVRGPLSTQPWASCRGKRTLSNGIFHCFQIVRTRELFPFPRSWHPGPATLVWGHAHTINSFKSRPSPKPKTRSCRGKRARPCDPGGIFVRRTFEKLFDPKIRFPFPQARAPFFLPLPLSLRCSGLAHQDQKNFLFLIPLSFEARHCALQFSQRGHTDPRLGRLDVIGGI